MVNLPPLPVPKYYNYLFSDDQMREYGQQCRDAALEEAAALLEKADLSGIKDDVFLMNYTGRVLMGIVTHIRSLKK